MKNLCIIYSATTDKGIIAFNPKAKFSGSNMESFKKFAKKHKRYKLIGYISYDTAYKLHNIKKTTKNDLKLPEIYFLAFNKYKNANLEEIKSLLIKNIKPDKQNRKTKQTIFKPTISLREYQTSYEKIKKYIKEGDIYQINLTHRLEAQANIPSKQLFLNIIRDNPVDFLTYIEGDNFDILSASPERFIQIKSKKIETCPIKGTRPRGETEKKDKELRKELIKNKKEAAELNMITDLLRNDMGRVCKIGSVKVTGKRIIKKCPTVWHTFSRITGKIKPDITELEALISMLPGGSITGCPKKRAIEIIDELEPKTRSVYTGVIGYINPNQNLDFSIAIRTIIKKGKKLYLQVGGGIVIDSKEEAEYKETLDKAKSFSGIFR
jgi:para-aminobenzoate synthetase component 1